MQERFNKQFVDKDTGLLNIGKYDHEEVLEFIENELKNRDNEIIKIIEKELEYNPDPDINKIINKINETS